jgi:signal transduction histidine kinase
LTRSRKLPQRLAPEEAATLVAHVQAQLEHERARIARRLHGDVAGMLAAARMDLSRMANRGDADWDEQVMRVDQILEAVIQNARSEMQRLHPALLDHFGLTAALRHLVEDTCRSAGAEFAMDLPEFPEGGVSAPVALAAYRVVERLLEGRDLQRVGVRLRGSNGGLLLAVDLDCTEPLAPSGRNDLLALRSWLESLGGAWAEAVRGAVLAVELTLPRENMATTQTTTS